MPASLLRSGDADAGRAHCVARAGERSKGSGGGGSEVKPDHCGRRVLPFAAEDSDHLVLE